MVSDERRLEKVMASTTPTPGSTLSDDHTKLLPKGHHMVAEILELGPYWSFIETLPGS
jgi:hypothetical protein